MCGETGPRDGREHRVGATNRVGAKHRLSYQVGDNLRCCCFEPIWRTCFLTSRSMIIFIFGAKSSIISGTWHVFNARQVSESYKVVPHSYKLVFKPH